MGEPRKEEGDNGDMDGGVNICRECGEEFDVNLRLNDGFCDDCRVELNELHGT